MQQIHRKQFISIHRFRSRGRTGNYQTKIGPENHCLLSCANGKSLKAKGKDYRKRWI